MALVSGAQRTRETYELVAVNASWDLAPMIEDQLYRAYINELIDAINIMAGKAERLLVVGHEPTMSATAHALAGPGSNPEAVTSVRTGLPTAGRAVLTFDGQWANLRPASAILKQVVVSGR